MKTGAMPRWRHSTSRDRFVGKVGHSLDLYVMLLDDNKNLLVTLRYGHYSKAPDDIFLGYVSTKEWSDLIMGFESKAQGEFYAAFMVVKDAIIRLICRTP